MNIKCYYQNTAINKKTTSLCILLMPALNHSRLSKSEFSIACHGSQSTCNKWLTSNEEDNNEKWKRKWMQITFSTAEDLMYGLFPAEEAVNVGSGGLDRRPIGVVVVGIGIGFGIGVVVVKLLFHLFDEGIRIHWRHGYANNGKREPSFTEPSLFIFPGLLSPSLKLGTEVRNK